MNKRKETLSKIFYASGDIYGGGSFLIVGLLLLAFLTKVEGLSGTWAGIVIFIGKLWDAVTDPVMGSISDKTRSRFGRRRLYFLLGSIPVFLSWVMLWYSFGINDITAKIVYYTLAYMFFSTSFTIVMVPYNAILADMTNDYNKRSAYTGMRLSFSAGSSILCGIIPGIITGAFAVEQTGYLVMALVFGCVFGLSWLVVFFGTWENKRELEAEQFTIKDWLSVFKNRSFRQYALIFVFSQMAIDIAMAIAIFYVGVSLQKDYLYIPAVAALLVVQLVFIIIFSIVAQKTSKRVPGIIAAAVWIIASVLIFTFTPSTPDIIIVAVCALIGVGGAGCNMVSWSILPDISDVDEIMTGKRREGLYSGVSTFLRKFSGGIAVGSIGIMLDLFKYDEAAVAADSTLPITAIGIKLIFCVFPVLLLVLMLIVLKQYRMGKREFEVMHEVLDTVRKKGRKAKLTAEQILVCEELTGAQGLFEK